MMHTESRVKKEASLCECVQTGMQLRESCTASADGERHKSHPRRAISRAGDKCTRWRILQLERR